MPTRNTINLGGTQIQSINLGSTSVNAVYLGSAQLWPLNGGGGGGSAQDYSGSFTQPTTTLDSTITTDTDSNLPSGAWEYPTGSTAFKYLGVDAVVDNGDANNLYMPSPFNVIGTTSMKRGYSVKFNMTGKIFWVRIKAIHSSSVLRVRVNNSWYIQTEQITTTVDHNDGDPDENSFAGTTNATDAGGTTTTYYVKVDFSTTPSNTTGPYTIQLDLDYYFGGVYVPTGSVIATSTVGSLPTIPARQVVGLSASLMAGPNAATETPYNQTTSHLFYGAYLAGWNNVFNEAMGGTGFSTTNGSQASSPSFLSRLQSATLATRLSSGSGHTIIMDGGAFNDLGTNIGTSSAGSSTSGNIYNWFNPVLTELAATYANCNVICIGIPLAARIVSEFKQLLGGSVSDSTAESIAINGGGGLTGLLQYNNVERQMCQGKGVFYVEPLNGKVYDTNGTLMTTLSAGMLRFPDYPTVGSSTYPTTYLYTDGVHPTKFGAYAIATYYAASYNVIKGSSNWQI